MHACPTATWIVCLYMTKEIAIFLHLLFFKVSFDKSLKFALDLPYVCIITKNWSWQELKPIAIRFLLLDW